MKNFTSVLRSHSGAVQARIPSLRSVTKQKSTPPFCKVCRWLMVLLVLAHPINQGEDSFIPQKIYTFVP